MSLGKNDAVILRGIQLLIVEVRGFKVIFDYDLASLYGVETRALNQAVKRNAERFPEDFVFHLTREDNANLFPQISIPDGNNRSQIVTGSQKHREPRALPYVFTEYGVLMAANVLRSTKAVEMSVFIVRAFVKMREALMSQQRMAGRLDQIEKILLIHDTQLKELFEKIRDLLLSPPEPPKKLIRFGIDETPKKYGKKAEISL